MLDGPKVKSPKEKLNNLFEFVDNNKNEIFEDLKTAIAIPSISHDLDHLDDVIKMLDLCKTTLQDLGALVQVSECEDQSNSEESLPPVLYADLFVDDELKTLCIYGHIDIPFLKTESSDENIIKMVEKDGRLFGRGISESKGPLFAWFSALKIYKALKLQLPVNVKFIIEGTAEKHSRSLMQTLPTRYDFLSNIEFVLMTIGKKVNEKPCIKYGYRGICHFSLSISCGHKDVHNRYGGAFSQPFIDAVHIMSSLVNKEGKIAVKEFMDDMKNITVEEYKHCVDPFFSKDNLKEKTGLKAFSHKEKDNRIVAHKTRIPSLSVHEFDTPKSDGKHISKLPCKVIAKFSVRLVPNQTVDRTKKQFKDFIKHLWNKSKKVNEYSLHMDLGFDPWAEDPESSHYKATASAIEKVYQAKPVFIREGYTKPVISIFHNASPNINIVVVPISEKNDDLHTASESISTINFINAIKFVMAYMCEMHDM